jgi:hypothetical protein
MDLLDWKWRSHVQAHVRGLVAQIDLTSAIILISGVASNAPLRPEGAFDTSTLQAITQEPRLSCFVMDEDYAGSTDERTSPCS